MLGVVALGWWLRWHGRLFQTGWFLRLCQWTAPLGFVAVLAGWTDDRGRPPALDGLWTDAHGALGVAIAHRPDVLCSFLAYMRVYLLMFPAGIAVMARMVRQGPREEAMATPPVEALQPSAPIADSAAAAPSGVMMQWRCSTWCRSGRRSSRIGVFLYVLLDGFDLGVGMLYGFAPSRARGTVMNSIAPIWDGNETWLILGGVALLAVFPLAFAIIIPGGLFPGAADAAGAGVPRRRLRVPLRAAAAQPVLGTGLLHRLDARRLRAGRGARRASSRASRSRAVSSPARRGTG